MNLGLKVLRLSRPTLGVPNIPANNPEYNTVLALPRAFGNVYVGEVFSCLICASQLDESKTHLLASLDVTLKLPSGSETALVQNHPVTFDPSANADTDLLVSFEARLAGLHVLNVHLSYKPTGEAKPDDIVVLRKHYRFNASEGINVKTKLSPLTENVVVEAQIENLTESTLTLETIDIIPSPSSTSETKVEPLRSNTSEVRPLLQPTESWQAAFILSADTIPSKACLTLSWRRDPLGEKGWLTTGPISDR